MDATTFLNIYIFPKLKIKKINEQRCRPNGGSLFKLSGTQKQTSS